jgi:uncharacterized membrane protein
MTKTILRYLLALIFIGSGVFHFVMPEMYVKVMPDFIPFPLACVLISGVLELAGGVGLLIPKWRNRASWLIVALLLSFLAVHIPHIINGGRVMDGITLPLAAVWGRLAFQAVFIVWARWVG